MNAGDPNTRRDGEEPEAPFSLVAALKEPPARRVFVPPTIDDAVLSAARRHLAGSRSGSGFLGRVRSWLIRPAMAAACLILVALIYFFAKPAREFAQEDLNHDGRVDILDAFQLAREAGTKPDAVRDLNSDGVVDQRDAEVIAARAVKLGGRS